MTNDKFRDQIELDFADGFKNGDFTTIEELEILMRYSGYNRAYDKDQKRMIKRDPTQTQLTDAWKTLKKRTGKQ